MSRHEVVVVGGGVAGLTAAAYLRRAGRSVLLLEKNQICGGLVNTFTRRGFTYEGGVRALIDGGILTPMLAQLGIELPMKRNRVSVGLEDRVVHIEDHGSIAEYEDLLTRAFPDSADDVAAIVALMRSLTRDVDLLYSIDNPIFRDPLREPRYVLGTLAPWSVRFVGALRRIQAQSAPFEHTLAQLTSNRSLADVVGQHLFKNTPTSFALSFFTLYLNYRYPLGGTGMLATSLERHNRQAGTSIRTGTRVVDLDARRRELRDDSGEVYGYDKLIWAADLKTLYRLTDAADLSSRRARRNYRQVEARLKRRRGGDSVLTVYLGCDLPPEYFRRISHGHFFYTPSKQGLGEVHSSELEALIHRLRTGQLAGAGARRRAVEDWLERFFRLNSFEISIPALRDPSMAPVGHTGLIASVLFEHDLCELVEADGWYEDFKDLCIDCVVRNLDASIYPGLAGHIVDRFAATPLTIARVSGSYGGAITGWTFEGGPPPVVHEIHKAAAAVRTPFPDILQAGQWTYSPSGVPIAILTGKLAADAATRAPARA